MPGQIAIPCMLLRGGTSKGAYFLKSDLPADREERDALLLKVMGSPDPRQIDGIGGAHPLTSKVAVVSPSMREGVDVDYLFLQVTPDQPVVSDTQNCGNILAGIGPFAIERGLVTAKDGVTTVSVYMVNSDSRADLDVRTPGGEVAYDGDAAIDGVPGIHAPIIQNYFETAGAQCGALLPSGNATDEIDGVRVTMIDNGMPNVIIKAQDFGLTGGESVADLEENAALKARLEAIRLKCGPLMNLGDVEKQTVPKMCLVSGPREGGLIATRSFIPHRVHQSVGVLAAATVAAAALVPGTTAAEVAAPVAANPLRADIEHPGGKLGVEIETEMRDGIPVPVRSGIVRTARKLFDGTVFALP
ncbi:4-oxalomesaconate tautomerase [Breoghania corrubedonensis]|uniref:4-oxalomesaconate tautomerase n=1 Tax=Breoghania corrubedonensis TaxID=665038 RepID=A0A2T5VH22_9HYPH|nr:4-oxalomesaconate tautomerase [Breoghania corrubedonensis]PTW63050.1 4-oxalomesaconate tautomerase [Breoghania corrubedonensis]